MLRTVLVLTPRPGGRDEILAAYRDSGILGVAVRDAGCIATELRSSPDPGAPLLVTALWARREDYDKWSRHPARADFAARLAPLLADAKTEEVTISTRAEGEAPLELAAERERMVATQIEARGVRDPRVLAALRSVPRHRFVPEELAADAYSDHPLPIGSGQTISQPYMVAVMTELLAPEAGDRVLEVGTGCGYQSAVLAELGARVHSIEIVPELAARARRTLADNGYGDVSVVEGDGWRGLPAQAPFDRIIVTAAPDHLPEALVEQLAVGGRMVIPVGDAHQRLRVLEKTEHGILERELFEVRFVPMVEGPVTSRYGR